MRSGFRKVVDDTYIGLETFFRSVNARKDARKYLKKFKVSNPQKIHQYYQKEVIPYWKKYGQKPSEIWFQYFAKEDGKTDSRYIPEDMYFGVILPYYNNMFFRRPYEDKCMHGILFPDVKRPRTIIMNMGGEFYNASLETINKEEAVALILKEQELIAKPSIDSGAGRLIEFFNAQNLNQQKVYDLLDRTGSNYIIQEIVPQHSVLSSLHKNSLNTIRVLSFFFEGKVYILSTIIRMGTGDSRIDNVTAGGMQCGIYPDGRLYEKSCTKKRDWVDVSPDGVKLGDVVVPGFRNIIETVERVHPRFPHFRLIGWDFSVSDKEEPILIEYNVCPGANQMTCGPTFGDITDRVLEDVFIKKSLSGIQN